MTWYLQSVKNSSLHQNVDVFDTITHADDTSTTVATTLWWQYVYNRYNYRKYTYKIQYTHHHPTQKFHGFAYDSLIHTANRRIIAVPVSNPELYWYYRYRTHLVRTDPDSKVHGANMEPTWVLSAPDGSHVGPMNLAIWGVNHHLKYSTLASSAIERRLTSYEMHFWNTLTDFNMYNSYVNSKYALKMAESQLLLKMFYKSLSLAMSLGYIFRSGSQLALPLHFQSRRVT